MTASHDQESSLIDRYFDGRITDEELVELNRLLIEDECFADQFVAATELDALLELCLVEGVDAAEEFLMAAAFDAIDMPLAPEPMTVQKVIPNRPKQQQDRFHFAIVSVVAAFSLCMTLLILTPAFIDKMWPERPVVETPVRVGATVAKLEGIRWSQGQNPLQVGQELAYGTKIQSDSGTIGLVFERGATIMLSGAVDFDILTDNSGWLSTGELAAVVPPSATGFIVQVHQLEIIDLGTQFSIRANDKDDVQVQVLEGEVVTSFLAGNGERTEQRKLTAGDAQKYDIRKREVVDVTFNASPFLALPVKRGKRIAYVTKKGTVGNQRYPGPLGHDFTVEKPIVISRLGVFDSEADGLKRTITASIWSRDVRNTPEDTSDDTGIAKLVEITFTPQEPGELVESNRFKALEKAVRLPIGDYTVMAHGYGIGEPNGNMSGEVAVDGFRGRKLTDGGPGILRFVGNGRFIREKVLDVDRDLNKFPFHIHPGTQVKPDVFSAGTFEYFPVE